MATAFESGPAARGGEYAEAGDPLPPGCAPIEVHVSELRNLFNAIDPAPFNDRDLDPSAEAFIVNWSKDSPRDAPLALLVHLDLPCDLEHAADVLRTAVHSFRGARAQRTAAVRLTSGRFVEQTARARERG